MNRQERDTMLYDIMESIMMSPQALEEVVTPLDSQRLIGLAETMRDGSTDVDYNNPLIEMNMEQRNKAGVALRGLWANSLAGRNTAQAGKMTVDLNYAPKIAYGAGESITFSEVARERDYVPGQGYIGDYLTGISAYLSAAVDAAQDPIQIDINDNIFTVPVSSLMLSVGVPVEDIVYFLAQPAIKEAVEYAQLNDLTIAGMTNAIKAVVGKYKGKLNQETVQEMSSQKLLEI